ncbi:MAG: multiheme c-type cytochrome [Planctomycetota bacterium]
MSLRARLLLALGLVAALAAVLLFLSGGGRSMQAAQTRWESSRQCQQCHQEVYDEWAASHHGIAFTNPEVRALSDDFRKEECMDCHLPRPLAVTGFGKRTLPRRTHFDEGVSCISCHLGADGGILGANDRPEVPCAPKRSTEFLSVDACMSCHNQHGTTDQWRASHYAAQGIHCTNCHMPESPRARGDGSVRQGRHHGFPGCHDEAMLRKAYAFAVTVDGGVLTAALTNTGAGHNFPTEERHRAVDIEYRFLGEDGPLAVDLPPREAPGVGSGTVDSGGGARQGGAPGWTRVWRCRQPYRDEPGENTQLPAGETVRVEVPVPAGAVRAEVRLWYRLTPFCDDADARSTLLEQREVAL